MTIFVCKYNREVALRLQRQAHDQWVKSKMNGTYRRTFDPRQSGQVKHLFAKAGTPHITGEGVYAFDHVAHGFSLAELREIEERYNA